MLYISVLGFGNDEDVEMTEEPTTNGESEATATPEDSEAQVNGEKSSARKVTLSYEKYRRIANTLILFMRQEEDKPVSEGKSYTTNHNTGQFLSIYRYIQFLPGIASRRTVINEGPAFEALTHLIPH